MFNFLCKPQSYWSFSARSTTICFIFCAIHNNIDHFLRVPKHHFSSSARSTTLGRSQYSLFFACGSIFSEKSQICSCDFEVVAILFFIVTRTPWLQQASPGANTQGNTKSRKVDYLRIFLHPRRRKKSQGYTKSRKIDYRRIFGALDNGDFRMTGPIVLEHK